MVSVPPSWVSHFRSPTVNRALFHPNELVGSFCVHEFGTTFLMAFRYVTMPSFKSSLAFPKSSKLL